ncbi:menaquinol-cytochrome c reductase cytochrome b/c subunit [Alkalihalobacillus pseudalcaliphilus]|uniref:menaquinol-cytochrome c reductase cytochrome b/c subunit n=1 Tax=Alkalihalobacillus pseudalcaliphilus TaxID=79884 RepID=UPI00064DE3DE|nr:menaquinol-cytochrome c reductase cytochrome b/c subunit [Alkalihalobacillus pseudalcaliphilus]KMK76421.1 cytochrome Cbb3 [Alkalihalobacillus pseudalcaliphilus]
MKRGKGMKFVGDSRVKVDGRMKNIPKDYSEYPGKTEAFWPNYLLKEWMVGAVFLMGFLCLTIAHPAPLEAPADPTAAGYIPLPDWYFLFLYQLLKYPFASGAYNVIGTVVIPGLAFGALLLAPFLDTGKERRPLKRPIASGLMMLGVIAVIFLTWESIDQNEAAPDQGAIQEEGDINVDAEGYEYYSQSCIGCHGDTMAGTGMGPSLLETEKTAEEIVEIVQEGYNNMPAETFTGSEEELQILAEYVAAHGQPEEEE